MLKSDCAGPILFKENFQNIQGTNVTSAFYSICLYYVNHASSNLKDPKYYDHMKANDEILL